MSDIYVFGPNDANNDYATFGLAGALVPTKCEFSETANGESILTMEHPLDDFGRYKCLQRGNILVAPVPVRTTPAINDQNGSIVTHVETYRLKPRAQLANDKQRGLFKKHRGSARIAMLDEGESVTVIEKPPSYDRWRAKTSKGEGWIDSSAFDFVETKTLDDNSASIEFAQSPWTVRNQPFRIYEVVKKNDGIEVSARHITYDLLYNMTGYYEWQEVTCISAAHGILNGMYDRPVNFSDIPFKIYTDSGNRSAGFDYRQKNIIDALLDPEEGVCKRFKVGMVRDDHNIYLLNDPGVNRGYAIEYGSNMIGVEFKSSDDGVVTRVMPIGETKDGDPLYLRDLLNGNRVDPEHLDEYFVDSPNHKTDYPVLHVKELKVEEAKIGDSVDINEARARMRAAAEKQFSEEHVDEMKVEMSVEFARLGETEEYKQFEGLDNCFLFDYVRVKQPALEIDTTAQIVQITWDCLAGRNGRMKEIKIGAVGDTLSNVGITTWQIPSGFSGSKIANGTVNGNVFKNATIGYAKIAAAAIGSLTAASAAIAVADIKQLTAQDIETTNLKAAIAEIADARIGVAEIDTAKIKWAEITNATIQTLQAKLAYLTTANITSANINWANIQSLAAKYARIENGIITNATIDQANVNNLSANYAHITNGQIDNATIRWADIDNLNAGFLTALNANINSATIGDAFINKLNATSAKISNIDVSNAKIGFAQVYDLTANDAIITKGVGGEFYIKNLAVTEASIVKLTVGTLLMRDSATGRMKRLVMDSSAQGGYVVADANEVVTGDNLVANTITAAKLNVDEIFTSNIMAGKILAQNLNVSSFWASQADIANLNTFFQNANVISAINDNLILEASGRIMMAAGKHIRSGSANLLRRSKTLDKGTDISKQWSWTNEYDGSDATNPIGTSLIQNSPVSGFNSIRFWSKNGAPTASEWTNISSPLVPLTGAPQGDWVGRKVTFSAYVYCSNWSYLTGFAIQLALSTGTKVRKKYKAVSVYSGSGSTLDWGSRIRCEQPIANAKWRRIETTFTLDENDLSTSSDDTLPFHQCTHMFASVYFKRTDSATNTVHIRVYSPKLEWGTISSDWSAAPEDAIDDADSVIKTYFTVEDGQIKGFVSEDVYDSDINADNTGLKYLTGQNTSFRTQTAQLISDFVESTAYGHPTDNLGQIFTRMWSGITVNKEGIALEANKLIGSTQLLKRTKGMAATISELGYSSSSAVPSDVDTSAGSLWRLAPTSSGTATITRNNMGNGEYAREINVSGLSSYSYSALHSPLIPLGSAWNGRKVTVSFYVRSSAWENVDDAFSITVNLSANSTTRLFTSGKQIAKIGQVEWADTGLMYEMSLRNNNWRRVAATFTLNESEFSKVGSHSSAFTDCTTMFISFYLRKNGVVRVRLPKVEWGEKASDWAEAADDVAESSSAKIKIASDSITSTVSTLDGNLSTLSQTVGSISTTVQNHTNDISRIDQKADGIDLEVKGINTGERNYLLESEMSVSSGNYWVGSWDFDKSDDTFPTVGDDVVITVWGTFTGRTAIDVYNSGGYVRLGTMTQDSDDPNKWVLATQWTRGQGEHAVTDNTETHLRIYATPNPPSSTAVVQRIKLEKGDRSTDWIPAIREYSSSVPSTSDQWTGVRIRKDEFFVNLPGSAGDLTLTPSGGQMGSLTLTEAFTAPNVTYVYTGPSAITVTNGSQLIDAIRKLNNRYLKYSVEIILAANFDAEFSDDDNLEIAGIHGHGWLDIRGATPSGSQKRPKITGQVVFGGCSAPITFRNIDVYGYAPVNNAVTPCVVVSACSGYITLSGVKVFGVGSAVNGSYGIMAQRGSHSVSVVNCETYDCQRGIMASLASYIDVYNSKGNSVLGANRGFMTVTGTTATSNSSSTVNKVDNPPGAILLASGITPDQGSGGGSPVTPTKPVTGLFYAETCGTYGDNGKWAVGTADGYVGQGYTVNVGQLKGCMWFASSMRTTLANKTITNATLRLSQVKGIGLGGKVDLKLYVIHNASTIIGNNTAPTVPSTVYDLGKTDPSVATEYAIPTEAITDLISGNYGFMLYLATETARYKKNIYSKNYAKFVGVTGSTAEKPLLTITYK